METAEVGEDGPARRRLDEVVFAKGRLDLELDVVSWFWSGLRLRLLGRGEQRHRQPPLTL